MLGDGKVGLAEVTVLTMNCTRTLSTGDEKLLNELVNCHKMIFPDSLQNILGESYLMRSFNWYIINHEKRNILVYEEEGKIIGFLTMRCSNDIDNFLKYIYKTIIWCFLSKPVLLLNISLMKKMLNNVKPKITLKDQKRHLELVSIGVLPSFENKGIGKELLREFEQYAINKKISLVRLQIFKKNKKAAKFYLSNGWFKKEMDLDDYYLFEKNIIFD